MSELAGAKDTPGNPFENTPAEQEDGQEPGSPAVGGTVAANTEKGENWPQV